MTTKAKTRAGECGRKNLLALNFKISMPFCHCENLRPEKSCKIAAISNQKQQNTSTTLSQGEFAKILQKFARML